MKTYRAIATSLLAAAMAALVLSAPASGQGAELPIQGGPGGGFFKVFCPANTFMVGLRGRAGVVLDNFQLLCAGFRTVNSIPPRKNWRRDPNVFAEGNPIGASQGGTALSRTCTGHNFVRGIQFNTALFKGAHLVAFITMTCDHGTLVGFTEPKFGFNFPPGFPSTPKQFCPEGFWATGIHGRAGGFVDAVGLLCAKMPPL